LLKEEADPLAVKLEKQWSGQQKGPRTKLVTEKFTVNPEREMEMTRSGHP